MKNKKRYLKNKYKSAFHICQKIINEWDPMDLIASHCPVDEYSLEIDEILVELKKCNNQDDCRKLLISIFGDFMNNYGISEAKIKNVSYVSFEIFKIKNYLY